MLIKGLYYLKNITKKDGEINADIKIRQDCEIYKGHFPEHPVTPGVCQILIIQEVLGKALDRNLILKYCRDVKFLSMHDPNTVQNLKINISYSFNEDDEVSFYASLFSEDAKYLKINGIFG